MTFQLLQLVLWNTSLVLAGAIAWLRGANVERKAALAFVSAAVSTELVEHFRWGLWQPAVLLGLDLALLAWLLITSHRSSRWWLMGAAGLMIDAVLMELAYLVAPHLLPVALWSGSAVWGYATISVFAMGAWLEGARPEFVPDRRATRRPL